MMKKMHNSKKMSNSSDEKEDLEITTSSTSRSKRNIKSKKEKFNEYKKIFKEQNKSKNSSLLNQNYVWQKRRNTLIISEDQYGNPILSIGPDWYYYVILSTIITGGFLFLFIYFHQYMPFYLIFSGIVTYLLFIVVYTRLFILNPGYPEEIDINLIKKGRKNYVYCSICNLWAHKDTKIRHCHRCGMCIEEYDHHCDWVGKCIGKKNMSDFYFIMIWIVMVIVYFIAAFVIVHNNWFEYQRYLRYVKKMNETKNK